MFQRLESKGAANHVRVCSGPHTRSAHESQAIRGLIARLCSSVSLSSLPSKSFGTRRCRPRPSPGFATNALTFFSNFLAAPAIGHRPLEQLLPQGRVIDGQVAHVAPSQLPAFTDGSDIASSPVPMRVPGMRLRAVCCGGIDGVYRPGLGSVFQVVYRRRWGVL